MLSDSVLLDWCGSRLGSRPRTAILRSGHLSHVLGVILADGRRVAIKSRKFEERIIGCTTVQAHLASHGFPCPAPLAGPDKVDGHAVTAETMIEGGQQHDVNTGPHPFASLLARLIRSAPDVARMPALTPSPPWTAWDRAGSRLWPDSDDHGRDLNQTPGPDWVDTAAAAVRRRLLGYSPGLRIGHGDWESQNIRWAGDNPLVVHDWDSVIAQPEACIVGLASAVWAAQGKPHEAASVQQSAEFLTAYQQAAGVQWSEDDTRAAWAAGLWVRLFNAKKDAAAGGGPQLDRLADELPERLSYAGLDTRSA